MKAKLIMVQGVGPDAGKSIVTGALCRHLSNQGVKVAPFKSILVCKNQIQENGLISDTRFIFSIRAARLCLSSDYNPIQLLPVKYDWLGQMMSPVTLHFPSGQIHEVPLFARDTPLFPQLLSEIRGEIKEIIKERLDKLCDAFEVVVVEGAGNPTDLGRNDLTNFFIAQEFQVATVLVTKLSAGGAAASLLGTYALLEPEIKETIAGYILNDLIDGREVAEKMKHLLTEKLNMTCLGILPNLWSVSPWDTKEEELEGMAKLVKENIDLEALLQAQTRKAGG